MPEVLGDKAQAASSGKAAEVSAPKKVGLKRPAAAPAVEVPVEASGIEETLTCSQCEEKFVFSSEAQRIHREKGFTHKPTRCPTCRRSKNDKVTPLCFAFQKGTCNRGDACRFEHVAVAANPTSPASSRKKPKNRNQKGKKDQ